MDIAEALLQLPLSTVSTAHTASNSTASAAAIPLTDRGERTYIFETSLRFDPVSGLIVDWAWEILAENSPPGVKTAIAAVTAATSSSSERGFTSSSFSSSSYL